MRQRFLPILFLATLLGCSKSDSNPIVDFGEGEGITYRTAANLPIGPRDYTDWTFDDHWNKRECALFPELSFDLNGTQQPALISFNSTYPNPSWDGRATWGLEIKTSSLPTTYSVVAALVDRQYAVRQRFGTTTISRSLNFSLDYLKAGFSPNELYRLYYVVYSANGVVAPDWVSSATDTEASKPAEAPATLVPTTPARVCCTPPGQR